MCSHMCVTVACLHLYAHYVVCGSMQCATQEFGTRNMDELDKPVLVDRLGTVGADQLQGDLAWNLEQTNTCVCIF